MNVFIKVTYRTIDRVSLFGCSFKRRPKFVITSFDLVKERGLRYRAVTKDDHVSGPWIDGPKSLTRIGKEIRSFLKGTNPSLIGYKCAEMEKVFGAFCKKYVKGFTEPWVGVADIDVWLLQYLKNVPDEHFITNEERYTITKYRPQEGYSSEDKKEIFLSHADCPDFPGEDASTIKSLYRFFISQKKKIGTKSVFDENDNSKKQGAS